MKRRGTGQNGSEKGVLVDVDAYMIRVTVRAQDLSIVEKQFGGRVLLNCVRRGRLWNVV